jgi:hypothetical protein
MTDQHGVSEDVESAPAPALARGVYSVCYYLAFGTVYAGHLAMEFVPADSVVRRAFHDGAEGARRALARAHEERATAEREMALPEEPTEPLGGA